MTSSYRASIRVRMLDSRRWMQTVYILFDRDAIIALFSIEFFSSSQNHSSSCIQASIHLCAFDGHHAKYGLWNFQSLIVCVPAQKVSPAAIHKLLEGNYIHTIASYS